MAIHHTSDDVCPLCEEKLAQVHPYLSYWFRRHVKRFQPNAHVSWGFRGKDDQNRFFDQEKTTLRFPLSPHNKTPAMAIDLFQLDDKGKAVWDVDFFKVLNFYNERAKINLRWGGNFKKWKDYNHFEIPKSIFRRLYEKIRYTL